MFNDLFNLLRKETGLSTLHSLIEHLDGLLILFNEEYMKDKNSKNAAIDCLIEILQKHKD